MVNDDLREGAERVGASTHPTLAAMQGKVGTQMMAESVKQTAKTTAGTVKKTAQTAKDKAITWATSETGKAAVSTGFWNANINAGYNYYLAEEQQIPTVKGYLADFAIGASAGGVSSKAKGKIADVVSQSQVYFYGNVAKDMMDGKPINYTNAVTGGLGAGAGYAFGKVSNKAATKVVEQVKRKSVEKGSKTAQFIQHGVEGSLGTIGATGASDLLNRGIKLFNFNEQADNIRKQKQEKKK